MGGQDKSTSVINSMQRVKVYRLNNDGKWDDQGTGHVTVDHMERTEDLGLYVIDEEDNETLLLHRISSDDIYRKQEGTIISWRDSEYSTELALSFQENSGCSYIWDHICRAQRNLHLSTINNGTVRNASNETTDLPAPELASLPVLMKTLTECSVTEQMRLSDLMVNSHDFFRKLMEIFHICEDLENVDALHMIFRIVRAIVLLSSPQIFEKIFNDDFIMDIIGCLEYDPDTPIVQHHRSFLRDHVVFKEAIPIKNPLVLSKIHQTYRVGYLKDTILPRVLDDPVVANMNSIIHANNAVVVSLLKDDNTFFHELFGRLRSPVTSQEAKKNLVYFFHEFCTVSRSLPVVQQHRLFRDLVGEGVFDIITGILQSEDKRLVLTGTDILILFMNQDPNLLRSYIIRNEGAQLFSFLVKGITTDFGDDMNCQFLEIIRCLLDSYTLPSSQREAVVEIFYEKHLGHLLDVIVSSCPSDDGSMRADVKPDVLSNISDLLCFCVLHYPYRIKCNFLLNNAVDKILLLTRKRERYVCVAAVRFMRTILSHKDENIMDFVVKNNLLKTIVDVFVENGDRYNLLHSAILELFEFIRKDNLRPLAKYIVESFWDQLRRFESVPTIKSLKVKYEQISEMSGGAGNTEGAPVNHRKRADDRALEKEEEDYFNYGSDEEEAPVSSRTGVGNGERRARGLVDYEDDEEDDDYRPPLPPAREPQESGFLELVRLRKRVVDEVEASAAKKQRVVRRNATSRPRERLCSSLCSTLSHTVLPSKKTEESEKRISEATVGERDPPSPLSPSREMAV